MPKKIFGQIIKEKIAHALKITTKRYMGKSCPATKSLAEFIWLATSGAGPFWRYSLSRSKNRAQMCEPEERLS